MWRKPKYHRRASDQIRSLTRGGILDEQAFWQIVRAEKERADRSGLPVTVAVFTVKEGSKEYTDLTDWNASSLCQLLRDTARVTDHVGVAGANELGVVLWGTRELGAYRFVNRLGEGAQQLTAGCDLFVYPELKPVADGSKDSASDQGCHHGSKNVSDPQGVLNQTAEVERQSQVAAATETQSDCSLDTVDFDESYSFGLSDQATMLLEEIDESLNQTAQPSADEEAYDDDVGQPPSGGGLAGADPKTSQKSSNGDGRGGVALMKPIRATVKSKAVPAPQAIVQSKIDAVQTTLDSDFNVQLEPLENLFLHPFPRWKRVIDLAVAGCGLVVLSPLLFGLACLIKLTSPGPVLFRQLREGYGGRMFQINKLRTMRVAADAEKSQPRAAVEQDAPAIKTKDDPRITALGSFLRKTCLDELPQLWNVILGDMTLVGPRSLDDRKSRSIARWGRRRLNVMPGLTCIWQVHGKSKVTFDEWMRMDIRYSQRVTLGRDLRLVFATLKQFLFRRARQ